MPRALRIAVALTALALALVAPAAAVARGPARPGSYHGLEYHHGKRTDFVTLRFSVSPDGRYLRSLGGTVHAECTVAGGTPTFMDFSLGYPGRRRIAAGGRLKTTYRQVTHTHGATVHRTLKLVARFSGDRATGTFAFQSNVVGAGPGCTYDADWRATRSR